MRRRQCQIPMGEHGRRLRAVRRHGRAEKDVGQTAPSLEQSHSPVPGEPGAQAQSTCRGMRRASCWTSWVWVSGSLIAFVFFRSSLGDVSVFCWLGTTSLYWWLCRNNRVPGSGHFTCCVLTPCLPPPLLIFLEFAKITILAVFSLPWWPFGNCLHLLTGPRWKQTGESSFWAVGQPVDSLHVPPGQHTLLSSYPLSLSLGLFCCNLVSPDLLTPEALDPFSFYRHVPVDLLPLHEFPQSLCYSSQMNICRQNLSSELQTHFLDIST